jgi:hypothetical protein
MTKTEQIIKAFELAEILGVDDYLLHSWDVMPGEDIVLAFSYTDYEGWTHEFEFNEEALENAVLFPGGLSLKDNKGETVDIQLYRLEAMNVYKVVF